MKETESNLVFIKELTQLNHILLLHLINKKEELHRLHEIYKTTDEVIDTCIIYTLAEITKYECQKQNQN